MIPSERMELYPPPPEGRASSLSPENAARPQARSHRVARTIVLEAVAEQRPGRQAGFLVDAPIPHLRPLMVPPCPITTASPGLVTDTQRPPLTHTSVAPSVRIT